MITSAVDDLCSTLQLSIREYSLSECRDMINKKIEESDKGITISNRQLKKLLIQKFGEKIFFSYSYQKLESQMFYSSEIRSGELVKKIRNTDAVVDCAKTLRQECKT